jgi:hypothetical protein
MTIAKFPREIQEFSDAFVQLQLKRHEADDDPDATMHKSAVLADIAFVETVIGELSNVALKHRRAFAAWGDVQETELEDGCRDKTQACRIPVRGPRLVDDPCTQRGDISR